MKKSENPVDVINAFMAAGLTADEALKAWMEKQDINEVKP